MMLGGQHLNQRTIFSELFFSQSQKSAPKSAAKSAALPKPLQAVAKAFSLCWFSKRRGSEGAKKAHIA